MRSPDEGGREWEIYQTTHITLRSDASVGRSVDLARHLEKQYQVLAQFVFPFSPRFEGVVPFSFFRQYETIRVFDGDRDFGGYSSDGWAEYTGIETLVVTGRKTPAIYKQLATIQLVHQFVRFHMPHASPWLAEGLAEYLKTIVWDRDRIVIGLHPLIAVQADEHHLLYYMGYPQEVLPVEELRRFGPDAFCGKDCGMNYTSAWSAVSALMSGHRRERFQQLLDGLHLGKESESSLFERLFSPQELRELLRVQRELVASVGYRTETRTIRDMPAPRIEVEHRKMSPQEVHLSWSRLLAKVDVERALSHAQSALELAPQEPEALMMVGVATIDARGREEGTEFLARAFEVSDQAPRYAAALLRAQMESDQLKPASKPVAASLARSAESAAEFELVANYFLRAKRPKTALRFARKSVEMAPGRPSGLRALSHAHAANDNYKLAVDLLERAIRFAGEDQSPKDASVLARYRRAAAGQ